MCKVLIPSTIKTRNPPKTGISGLPRKKLSKTLWQPVSWVLWQEHFYNPNYAGDITRRMKSETDLRQKERPYLGKKKKSKAKRAGGNAQMVQHKQAQALTSNFSTALPSKY
jgi:hypothetical protein